MVLNTQYLFSDWLVQEQNTLIIIIDRITFLLEYLKTLIAIHIHNLLYSILSNQYNQLLMAYSLSQMLS